MTNLRGAMAAISAADSNRASGDHYPAACWDALVFDSGASVLLVDSDGKVHFANESAARSLGLTIESVIGKSLGELQPGELGAERTALVRRVVQSGRPLVVDGVVKGVMTRQVLRPYHAGANVGTRVLSVTRPISPDQHEKTDAAADFVRARVDDNGAISELTEREREILALIGSGLSTADIAKKLGRSAKTIEWHRVSLGEKLKCSNRVELARIAIHAGLVGVDSADGSGSNGNGKH